MRTAGWMPRASSRSSSSPWASCVLRRGQELAGGRRVLLELRADHAQVERDRHEPLLRAVVQVALEPPALGVAGLDDARARRGQLLVGVGVRERLRDQLGEVAQALLDAVRERVGRPGPRGERAPEPPADGDRGRHRGAVAGALQLLGERPARVRVLRPLRAAAAQHLRDDGVAVEVDRARDREPQPAVVAPAAHDRRRAGALVAHDARPGHAQQQRDLLGHLLEHAARRRARRRRAWRPCAAPPARPRARAGMPRSPSAPPPPACARRSPPRARAT